MSRIPPCVRNPTQIFTAKPGLLRNIVSHAGALLSIQARLRSTIPGDFYVAAVAKNTLHLTTPSAALATRLRYTQRSIILVLSDQHITKVKVSVRPEPALPAPKPRPAKLLSADSARHVNTAAQYIEDPALRKALICLSTRTKS
jgi:hypothetical protein